MLNNHNHVIRAVATIGALSTLIGCGSFTAREEHNPITSLPGQAGRDNNRYGEGGQQSKEDFKFGQMDNASAHVIGAIEMYIHRHGRTPKDRAVILRLAAAIAKPDKIDPAFKFTWNVKGIAWDRAARQRRGTILVKVTAPGHTPVTEEVYFYPGDGSDTPPGVKF